MKYRVGARTCACKTAMPGYQPPGIATFHLYAPSSVLA